MSHTERDGLRLSVDSRDLQTPAHVRQAFINSKIGAEFLDIEKHVAWNGGFVLDQVICRRTKDGWLMLIKVHRNSRQVVAFVAASTYTEAYELAGEFASRGCLTWQDDKWPPKPLVD